MPGIALHPTFASPTWVVHRKKKRVGGLPNLAGAFGAKDHVNGITVACVDLYFNIAAQTPSPGKNGRDGLYTHEAVLIGFVALIVLSSLAGLVFQLIANARHINSQCNVLHLR